MDRRDFFKQAFTVAELRALLKSLHLTPHDVLSVKSPAYKAMGLAGRELGAEELLALMVQEPRLIRRPLVVINGRPIVGFDREAIAAQIKR